MFIMRWLAGHPIVAIWFLGLIAFLLNYDAVYNNKSTTEHTDAPHEITDVAKKPVNKLGDLSASNVVAEGDKTETLETVKIEAVKPKESLEEEVSHSKEESSSSKLDLKKAVAEKEVVKEIKASIETEKPIAVPIDSTSKGADTNIEDLMRPSSSDLLIMAREAYWNNGLNEAASLYQELIKLEPNEINHKGELGNVYWKLGYPKKAAELYSEIAIPMIETGNAVRVANMVGFIGLFYPERATEINSRLQH